MKDTFLHRNFFIGFTICIVSFSVSYVFPVLLLVSKLLLLLFVILVIIDWYRLYILRKDLNATRSVPELLSLSDGEEIQYSIQNNTDFKLAIEFYDELPKQFQHRNSIKQFEINEQAEWATSYDIRPKERGEYEFGKLHLYYSIGPFYLSQRRISFDKGFIAKVVPSIKQMKKNELEVFSQTAALSGIRKIRSIGQNDEFEHIRPYVQGDSIKAINWKATSRSNAIMVDQYQDSRHQKVYCILDKGRSMKMPFNGMTLQDYSINSILSLSNIILRKYDYAGLISFSEDIGTIIKASGKKGQLDRISKSLYKEQTTFQESNFELLLQFTRRNITQRSIWLFFTNFETPYDLDRQLPYLRMMNKRHLVVVIIFINTVLIETSEMQCEVKSDIYLRTFAEKAILEKQGIKERLIQNGIQTILTKPENLSVNVINKYLEIKSRRLR